MNSDPDRTDSFVRFKLPRFRCDRHPSGLFSFRKSSINILGVYLPGAGVVVFDPITSAKNDTPRATVIHEEVHQDLMINTSFGIFHQHLEHFVEEDDTIREACRISFDEQWSVQELDATYSELMAVARWYPQRLDEAIARLPSESLGQPPYREIYNGFAQYLPISSSIELPRLIAQQALLHCMIAWSMSNDCLVQFADRRNFTLDEFRRYLKRESPHRRFERLLSRLLSTCALWALLERVVIDVIDVIDAIETGRPKKDDPAKWLLPEFSSLLGEPKVIIDIEVIKRQLERFLRLWHGVDDPPVRFEPPKLTMIRIPPHEHYEVLPRLEAVATLTIESLQSQFAAMQSTDLGVFFGWSADGREARVHFGTYVRDERGFPAHISKQPGFEPLDLVGLLPFEDVCQALEVATPLPHILIFRGFDTWSWWKGQPSRAKDPESRIWVCSERRILSEQSVADHLQFRNIGHGARWGILGTKSEPFYYWGFIVNPSMPNVYAMTGLGSDAAADLFSKIASHLGIERLGEMGEENDGGEFGPMLAIIPKLDLIETGRVELAFARLPSGSADGCPP
jgi:hypothetical protein